MVITEPGKITRGITLLGRMESCVYIVDGGDESVMIGGGMMFIVPDILKQMEEFGIDEKKIRRLIILHSHFDHCGIVPYLKKRWPWAVVTASARAKQLLSDPKVCQNIAILNQAATIRAGLEEKAKELALAFTKIDVEEEVGEGDVIECGGLTLEVIDVPGHSSCSIALYMPQEKALFASDAGGIRYKDYFLAAGNSNFDLYEKSLQKMAGYDVDVVMGEHYGASVGEDARKFLPNSIEAAKKMRAMLEESYRRSGDVNKSTEEITEMFIKEAPDYFLPREVVGMVVGMMVKNIARAIDGR